jgi:hypothetical protein
VTGPGDSWPPPGDGQPTYPQYQGPPPTLPPEPGPPVPPYPDPYGPPNPYGYPYLAGYGYPGVPPGRQRPGTLTAAAVLGYVNAGLLVIAGLLLFAGASLVNSLDDSSDGVNVEDFTAELTFDGFLNLLAAGLLIAGGVIMSARRPNGRLVYSLGAGVVVAEVVYWLGRWGSRIEDISGVLVYGLLFGALAVTGAALAWTRDGTGWLSSSQPAPQPPYFR